MDSVAAAGLLLGIVALSDGLRLLPASAIVIRRGAFGGWSLPPGAQDARTLRLVSWCIPLALPLIMEHGAGTSSAEPLRRRVTRFRARQRRVRPWIVALRAVGFATLLALIAGLPFLIGRSGSWGLMVGIALVFALALTQAGISAFALRRAGVSARRAVFASLKFCWPFTAPRAAEEVQRRVVVDIPVLVVLHHLLPGEDFERIARPMLYDALVRDRVSPEAAAMIQYLGDPLSRAFVARLPGSFEGDAFCPRCGTGFNRGPTLCSDCDEVALTSAAGA